MIVDLYKEKDFVEVVDADGHPVQGFASPVPKAWVGTDLLPQGAKAKGRAQAKPSTPTEPQVPAESENRDVLEAYAVEHAGMTEEQAKEFANKGELHAAITKAVGSGS